MIAIILSYLLSYWPSVLYILVLMLCHYFLSLVLNNKRNADQDVFSASDVIDSLSAHGWTGTSQQQVC